jgi:hypothetical protein
MIDGYPVPGRSASRNRRIANHEIGHAFLARALGNSVHSVTIIPDRGVGGYEGRFIRSGPPSQLIFDENNAEAQTDEILDVCSHLERMAPECGSGRVADSELVIRAQCMVIELVGGTVAEKILHPDQPSLGAKHDHVEAAAFARVACVAGASPAVAALISYAEAEAAALLTQNLDIVKALVEELIEAGTLTGDRVDEIISAGVVVRSLEMERRRRAEWRRREVLAEDFLKGAIAEIGF